MFDKAYIVDTSMYWYDLLSVAIATLLTWFFIISWPLSPCGVVLNSIGHGLRRKPNHDNNNIMSISNSACTCSYCWVVSSLANTQSLAAGGITWSASSQKIHCYSYYCLWIIVIAINNILQGRSLMIMNFLAYRYRCSAHAWERREKYYADHSTVWYQVRCVVSED